MKIHRLLGRAWLGRGVALGAALLLMAGCDELLTADNPEQILEEELNDEQFVDILVNSVIGDFQNMYDDPFIWRGSMFTDMQITGINWEQTARLSQRVVRFNEGDADLMFRQFQTARALADSTAGRFRAGLLENASSDARMATVLAYAGYSYILMAETLCQSTINLGPALSSEQMAEGAVARFSESLQVAQAAGRGDLANLARVGLARANLWLGNWNEVMTHAGSVPEGFAWWAEYSDNSPREQNTLFARISGSNHSLGVHPNFVQGPFLQQDLGELLTDPRHQHWARWRTGHNALSPLYTPYQGLRYSGYNGETIAGGGQPAAFTRDMDVMIAGGLEARHHFHEALLNAQGAGAADQVLSFINERRAYGNQEPFAPSGSDLVSELYEELRWQRGKDLFLGGFRLGDLRRWERQLGLDLFPQGIHPTEQWGLYGDAKCFPIPSTEIEANPNLTAP